MERKRPFLFLMEFSERIWAARFYNIKVIAAYANIEEASAEMKVNFYNKCQDEINRVPKIEVIILLVDLNSKLVVIHMVQNIYLLLMTRQRI